MQNTIVTASDRTQFVKDWIYTNNYSYPQAAEILGIHPISVARYFSKNPRDRRIPSWGVVCKIKEIR